MRVSAAQFFAMSEADRKQVTHIDMDLDRAEDLEIVRHRQGGRSRIYGHPDEPTAEPGTDWTKP